MEAKGEPLTQSVRQTAKELGIGVNQAYEAVRRGENPNIKIGKRILGAERAAQADAAGGRMSDARNCKARLHPIWVGGKAGYPIRSLTKASS